MKKTVNVLLVLSLVFLSATTAFAMDYAAYTENMGDFLYKSNPTNAGFQGTKNGFKTVLYVSAEDMGRQPGDYDKGMYIAAGSGIYTSTDGINWAVRSTASRGHGGGTLIRTAEVIRQAIAYGGASEKKLIATSDYDNDATTYVFSSDLSERATYKSYAMIGETKTYLWLTTVVWDKYTQKFWGSANQLSGSATSSAAGIYYTSGNVENNEMLWTKVDLGDADFYADANSPTPAKCMYTYISTDNQGRLTYYPLAAYASEANRYKFGIINTDTQANTITAEAVTLDGINIFEPGSETPVVLNDVAASTGVTYGKTYVSSAVLDGNGNVTLGLTGAANPTATRIALYHITNDRLQWLNDEGKTRGQMKYVATNGNRTAAIALDAAAYTSANRQNGILTLTTYDYNDSAYSAGKSVLAGEAEEKLLYSSGEYAGYYNTCMAVGQDGTIIVAQTVKAAGEVAYRGRLVTLKPTVVMNDNGEVISETYTVTGIDKVGTAAYQNLDQFYVRASSDDVWSSSSLGTVMVRETAVKNLDGVTTYSGWTQSGSGSTATYYKWVSGGKDYEIIPTAAGADYFDSSGFELRSSKGDYVNGNKQFITGAGSVLLRMPKVTETVEGKLRLRISNSLNRSQFREKEFSFTIIPDEYITVNGMTYLSEEAASDALVQGENTITAKYNLRPASALSEVMTAVAIYKNMDGTNALVNLGLVMTPAIAQNAPNSALPQLSGWTFDIPAGDDPMDYTVKTLYWAELRPY